MNYLRITICILALTGISAFAHDSTDNEEWKCSSSVERKHGQYDYPRCGNNPNKNYACYEDVKETCKEKSLKRTMTFKRAIFITCTESPSNCR